MKTAGYGKENGVTTIAVDPKKLRELDSDTKRAWQAYRDRTHQLKGEAYDYAELESWAILQNELRRLERRRRQISVRAA
jgi:hypothetical protein